MAPWAPRHWRRSCQWCPQQKLNREPTPHTQTFAPCETKSSLNEGHLCPKIVGKNRRFHTTRWGEILKFLYYHYYYCYYHKNVYIYKYVLHVFPLYTLVLWWSYKVLAFSYVLLGFLHAGKSTSPSPRPQPWRSAKRLPRKHHLRGSLRRATGPGATNHQMDA